METAVIFNIDPWDGKSKTLAIHLSCMIQTLLPVRMIALGKVERQNREVYKYWQKFKDGTPTGAIVTGSMAEGFCIPTSRKRGLVSCYEMLHDVDVLFLFQMRKISAHKLPAASTTDFCGYLEYYNSLHPGYARIVVLPCGSQACKVHATEKQYLNRVVCNEMQISELNKISHEIKDPRGPPQQHGPAATFDGNEIISTLSMQDNTARLGVDFVLALPFSPWPHVASSWAERKRLWPSPDVVQAIIDDGIHVVGVASKKSADPDHEWRISFSASEERLAREAITDHQRQCFIFLKILRHQVMKPFAVLSSYVFKSVFLHCCEKIPISDWETSPGNCVFFMLDILLECMKKKHVPTYFLPENNLVDHLSESELLAAISCIENIRRDPISPILDFTDTSVLECHPKYYKFGDIVNPLIEDIIYFKEHRDEKRSILNGIWPSSNRLIRALLRDYTKTEENPSEESCQEAVRYHIDVYKTWLYPELCMVPLEQFLTAYADSFQDLAIALRYSEAMLAITTEHPEFLNIRGNLACFYHAYAYNYPTGSRTRNLYLSKAGDMFKEVYEETGGCVIDYATYLVKRCHFDKALYILQNFIGNNCGNNSSYHYDKIEIDSLGGSLKEYVNTNGEIRADAVSFAYFYIITCMRKLGVTDDISTVFNEFASHCKAENNDHRCVLLKLIKDILSDQDQQYIKSQHFPLQ